MKAQDIINPFSDCNNGLERANMQHFIAGGALDLVVDAIIPSNNLSPSLINEYWKGTHVCPVCSREITSYEEFVYFKRIGECFTHDVTEIR